MCVYVDLYKGSYYCRLSNLLDINAPNICLLPIKKETQARQGVRKVLVFKERGRTEDDELMMTPFIKKNRIK